MAITSDPAVTVASAAAVSVLTIPAVTVSTTPSAVMGVRVHIRQVGVTVLSVVWGTKSLLLQASITGTNNRQEKWYAAGLTPGTNNVVVTLSGNSVGSAGAVVRYGVDQLTPIGNAFTASGTSTAPSVNVTSADPLAGLLASDGLTVQNPTTATVGAGQMEEYNIVTTVVGAGSRRTFGGNPQTMSWTLAASRSWTMIGTYWRPARKRIALNWLGVSTFMIRPRVKDGALEAWKRRVDAMLLSVSNRLRDY